MVNYILLFDGDCGICSFFADWVKKKDSSSKFDIIPYQSFSFDNNTIDLKLAQRTVILLDNFNSKTMIESAAIFKILSELNGLCMYLGNVFNNKFLIKCSNPIYRLIAKNRLFLSKIMGLKACNIK